MFKTKRNYKYDDLASIPDNREYKIMKNDEVAIQLSPNKGAVEIGSTSSTTIMIKAAVEFDGTIKIPILGRLSIINLSVREAELMLEERFKEFYIDPFVKLSVSNKRVILFPGSSGAARVVTLQNQNTTLTEVIALSGGITGNAKAHRVKLIRGEPSNPQIYLIDLSTIEGMKAGNIVLQGNDIVYIEPVNDYIVNFTSRISVYFTTLNLFVILYSILK